MRKLVTQMVLFAAVILFSGWAWAAPMVDFDLSKETILPDDTFTVDISLKASGTSLEIYSSFGAFYDYDDSQLELLAWSTPTIEDPANPGDFVPLWRDTSNLNPEGTISWHTSAGWTSQGYAAPPNFEEGEDLLVTSLLSFSAPQAAIGSTTIPLATLQFKCIGPGTSLISAFNRPDSNYIAGGGLSSDSDFDWENSFVEVNQVPLPGAVWILGSGLLGLIGLRRKFKG